MSSVPAWRRILSMTVLVGCIALAVHTLQGSTARDVQLVLALTDVDWSRDGDGGRELMTREKLSRLMVVLYTEDGAVQARSRFDFERRDGSLNPPFAADTGPFSIPDGSYTLRATLLFRAADGTEVTQTREQPLAIAGDGRIDVRL